MRILIVIIMCAVYARAQSLRAIVADTFHSGAVTFTLVQQTSTSTCSAGSGTTISCVLGSNFTSGNFAALSVWNNNTLTVSSISGLGCTWTKSGNAINSAKEVETWRGTSCSGGSTTATVTMSGTMSLTAAGNLSEWNGPAGTEDDSCANAAACGTTGSTSTPATVSVVPGAGEQLLVTGGYRGSGSVSSSSATGTGCTATALNTPNSSGSFSYCIVTSTSGNYTLTWVASSAGAWSSSVMGIK